MNSLLNVWQLLGWTMILFLAGGTVVFLIGGALRMILQRANAHVRYASSLITFAVLAILPLAIAGYLAANLEANLPRQWGEISATNLADQRREKETTNDTKELLNAEFAKNAKAAGVSVLTKATRQRESSSTAAPTADVIKFDFTSLLNHFATYLPWLWVVGTPLTFLLLATGLIGAERLRSSCQIANDGPIRAACDELRAALGIRRQVGVAVCERIATPLLVGVAKPLILLPPAALTGWTTAELEMVLVHELAHVRRWDNVVNLAQRIVESLLFFHPAVWIVSGWVRRDREDCCDAVVVRHTAKPQAYAELLLTLASHIPGLATSVAMAQHPLAGRVRRILKLEDEPMLVTRKGLFVGVSAVVVAALLAFALPTTDAEEAVSREAERVGGERASTTNPPRQRGEEQTTKDTNNTKEELNAKDAKKAEGAEKSSLFPTLEDQRAADLAYKLLGVELEKLTPEELERVKAKGYKGGLKVAGPIVYGAEDRVTPLRAGDLLVGLHVWPTESLEQLTEILSRDDLDQLEPLKYYVIRANHHHTSNAKTAEPEVKLIDYVVSGRIRVNLDAWRELCGETKAPQPSISSNASGESSPLLYDSKTFDEWRNLWKTELKTEKRGECIKALAAFGRAGKGKEAAEAILDVAAEYDFAIDGPRYIEDNEVGKLKESILEVLTNYGNHLPESDWLPELQLRLNKDTPSYRGFASQVLPRLVTSEKSVRPILSALQQSEDQAIRLAALTAIFISQEVYRDEEKDQFIQAVLAKEPVTAIRVLDQRLLNYVSVEQAAEYLVSEDTEMQLATRHALHPFFDKEKGSKLAEQLLTILDDKNRQQDKLAAVRALAALRYQANVAEPALTKIIESTENEELMIAATYARDMVTLKGNHRRMAISGETKNAIKKDDRWQEYLTDDAKLNAAIKAESQQVFGTEGMFGGGGMGGMGGGGGGGAF